MKKIICIIAFLSVFMSVFAEEIIIGNVTAKRYNDIWKNFFDSEILLRYDTEKQDVTIYIEDTLCLSAMVLNLEKRDLLISYIDKYIEWNKQASSKGVKLEKEINRFNTPFFFKYGEDWHRSVQDVEVITSFFSRTEQIHEFILTYGKITASDNEFMTCRTNDQYFTFKAAKELKKVLSQETIDLKLVEFEKTKALKDEFK